MFEDLSNEEAAITEPGAYIPAIPKLYHWFRRYVVADLACILRVIHTAEIPRTHQDFLELCFASIIRAASNADPVPVSGLEVTAHMKRRDARGRLVNPFALFKRNVLRSLDDVEDFVAKASPVQIGAMQLDAAMVRQGLRGKFDIVVTSPPYNNAVDYYRRHQLETYWLGFTRSQAERIDLKRRYIGRPRISVAEREVLAGVTIGPLATTWYRKMFEVCPQRADAFKLYIASLGNSFRGVAAVLHRGAPVVCVVGHSRWRDEEIPLSDLLVEAAHSLRFEETLYYPVSNRYMSYTRRNGANIDREYAVVLRKR
jgi:hypothetical protein